MSQIPADGTGSIGRDSMKRSQEDIENVLVLKYKDIKFSERFMNINEKLPDTENLKSNMSDYMD